MGIISNFRKNFLNPENSYLKRVLAVYLGVVDFQQWFVDFPQVEVSFG